MNRCPKGEAGKPRFARDDVIGFYFTPYNSNEKIFCTGKVYIVDTYGTFGQDIEPSYDVMVDKFCDTGEPCLVKHIKESDCYIIEDENIEN